MNGHSSMWETIRAAAVAEGVDLFDVDLPSDARRGGVLRVYITRPAGKVVAQEVNTEGGEGAAEGGRGGVTFEDCVRVSKRLLDIDERDGLIPDTCTLEVSSPGVNRRLRLPEHFAGAVGERVRVKFRDPATSVTQVVLGELKSVSDGVGVIVSEATKQEVSFDVREVKEARVDFKF